MLVRETSKFELVVSKDGLDCMVSNSNALLVTFLVIFEGILYEGEPIDVPDCIINRVVRVSLILPFKFIEHVSNCREAKSTTLVSPSFAR